jgi:hypothetical protein
MTADHTHAWEECPDGQVRCFECDAVKPTTAAERKRRQRERDRQDGLREVTVKVHESRVREIREIAACMTEKKTRGK